MNDTAFLIIGMLFLQSMVHAQPNDRAPAGVGIGVAASADVAGLIEQCSPIRSLPDREAASRAILAKGLPNHLPQLKRLAEFVATSTDLSTASELRRALLEKVEGLSPTLPVDRRMRRLLETSILAQISMNAWRRGDKRWNQRYIHSAEQAMAEFPDDPEATAEMVRAHEFEGALLWSVSLQQARTAYQQAADLHARSMTTAGTNGSSTPDQQARMLELKLKVNDADWDLGRTEAATTVYEKAHAELLALNRSPAWYDAALVLVAAYQVRGTQAIRQGDKTAALEAFALALTVADDIDQAPVRVRGGLQQLTKRCAKLAVETALTASLWQTAKALWQTQDLPSHQRVFQHPLPQDGEAASATQLKHLTIELLKLRSASGLAFAQEYERARRTTPGSVAQTQTTTRLEEMKSLILLGLALTGSNQSTRAALNFERADAIALELRGRHPQAALDNWRATILANLAATEFNSGNRGEALAKQREANRLLADLGRQNNLTPACRQLRQLLGHDVNPGQIFEPGKTNEPFWIDLLLEQIR